MKRWASLLICTALGLALLALLTSIMNYDALPAAFAARNETTVTIIDLGTLGGETSSAADLNNLGQVVGSSTLTPTARLQGFLWSADDMQGLAANNLATMAYAVNEEGQVAGTAVTGPNAALDQRPVLWQEDTFVPLPLDNTLQGSARAINDQGQIAGQTLDAAANALLLWEPQGDSFALIATVPFSSGLGQVNQLNNQGQIVGHVSDGDARQAFLWIESAGFMPLDTLGGTESAAYDINELGHIAGSSTISSNLASHATLWLDGQPQDLGAYEGDSRALGLNDSNVVVGEAELNGEPHAVLWAEGEMFDLNDFLPAESPWDRLQTAVRINNDGWIAGTGLINGQERAFLMYVPTATYLAYLPVIAKPLPTPTPEPSPTPAPSPTPSATPTSPLYDMMKYMGASTQYGPLYEVEFSTGSQSRHQTQMFGPEQFFHTKSVRPYSGDAMEAEWEELWSKADRYIYRGTDTSPGGNEYYTQFASKDGAVGARWVPRFWRVGDIYERNPYVVFFNKDNCNAVRGGWANTWLRFDAFYPQKQFFSSNNIITLNNVVELSWLLSKNGTPEEKYYYAEGYGLVAWESRSHGFSRIAELVVRPNNVREVIPCLQASLMQLPATIQGLDNGPLPLEYLLRIK